jgi:VanZ family protein
VKIVYGSPGEKALLSGVYLLAAAASAAVLLRGQMLSFPYLWLPVYLALCALALRLVSSGPGRPTGTVLFRGLYRTLPTLCLMGAIYRASSFTIPTDTNMALPDYVFHLTVFFALGLLTARMVAPDMEQKRSLRPMLLAFSIILGYGLLDEFHQGFVPGREPSWLDLLCDASGGLLGILAYPVLFRGPRNAASA